MTDDNSHPLAGLRCLIVEDEGLIAIDYEQMLRSAGADSVVSVGRLAGAYAVLASSAPFDLVFLDVDIDGESSLPLARALTADRVPIVIVTGLSGKTALPPDLQTLPRLEKPFDRRAMLAACLTARRGSDESAATPLLPSG